VQVNLKDDLLLAKNYYGQSAWHIAALKGSTEIVEKLWSLGKEEQVNLEDDLFLGKNRDGETAFSVAAMNGNIEILLKL
jgi:ankyrin repeat protein